MSTETKQVIEMLNTIKSELDYIKENMPNKDMFLTIEEKQLLEESYVNEKKRNLLSSKDLRKQLGI